MNRTVTNPSFVASPLGGASGEYPLPDDALRHHLHHVRCFTDSGGSELNLLVLLRKEPASQRRKSRRVPIRGLRIRSGFSSPIESGKSGDQSCLPSSSWRSAPQSSRSLSPRAVTGRMLGLSLRRQACRVRFRLLIPSLPLGFRRLILTPTLPSGSSSTQEVGRPSPVVTQTSS